MVTGTNVYNMKTRSTRKDHHTNQQQRQYTQQKIVFKPSRTKIKNRIGHRANNEVPENT
jgi:hypothetical protein